MTYMQPLPSPTGSNYRLIIQVRPTPSQSTGRYGPSRTDFVNSFYAVLRRWRSETALYSDPDKITGHPCFQKLVQFARLDPKLVIDELLTEPSLLVWVLDDAFADRPYLDDQAGNISAMTNAWIAWAERNEFSV